MEVMEKKQLLEYIKSAIELETDIIAQSDIQKQYLKAMDKRKPVLSVEALPEEPQMPVFAVTDHSWSIGIGILGGMLIFMGILMMDTTISAFWNWLSIIAGCALVLLVIYAEFIDPKKSADKYYEEVYWPQKQKTAELRKLVEQRNKTAQSVHSSQTTAWNNALSDAKQKMYITQKATKDTLLSLYAMDYIYPKYRNLPALTSIYEYLVTGRCEDLAGPHGAYNLYEDELRKDTVISQLNTVIKNLEQIKQNQYMLYQQVKIIQGNTNKIVSELRQIKGHVIQISQLSALNAYYAALTERNTRITMYYHL